MQSRGKIMVELAQKTLQAATAAGHHAEPAPTSEDFSSDDSMADSTYCPNKDSMDDSTSIESTDTNLGHHTQPPLQHSIAITPLQLINHDEPLPVASPESNAPSPTIHQNKQKKAKPLQLLNECSCKKKCGLKFDNNRRQAICDQFKKMNFAQRQLFFEAFILQKKKHYHSSSTKRTYTYIYHLPLNAENTKQIVCKTMFLHTIGRKTDGLVTEFFKRRNENTGLVSLADHRGEVVNRIKIEKSTLIHNEIRNHILSFHPQVSHYKLEHAPNRRYLSSEITVKFMWNDFITKFGNVASYVTYSKIFKKENIGFDKPSQDECPVCAEHKQHQKELKDIEATRTTNDIPPILMITSASSVNHSDNCAICQQFVNHKLNYTQARKYYKIDKTYEWPQNVNIFTVDMQKVIIIPKMKSKNSYFVSRLVVFNETFALLHQHDHTNMCVIWHEAITGRSASDVASSFLNIIQQSRRDVSKFIFWADNCSAQNKNWILYSALLIVVNQSWSPETITIKYFEPGHSYMRSDSVHGNIGKKWKNTQEVLDMDDLVELIKKADGKNDCRLLVETDFYNFKNICQKRSQKNNLPFLKEIKVVEFRQGSKNLFYKNTHESDNFNVYENIVKLKEIKFPEKRTEPTGLNAGKMKKISEQLLPQMPVRKRIFWEGLKSNENARDLCNFYD